MEVSAQIKNYLNYDCYFSAMGIMRIKNKEYENIPNELAKEILEELNRVSIDELIRIQLEEADKVINASNIPQFSRFEVGAIDLVDILFEMGDYGITFVDLGKRFLGEGKTEAAYQKYGENHSKLAKALDLVYIVNQTNSYVYLTELGYEIKKYSRGEQEELVAKLAISIPIIRYIFKSARNAKVNMEDILINYLSESTAKRRKASINQILKYVQKYSTENQNIWGNVL